MRLALTLSQAAFLKTFHPHYLNGLEFLGDDNDLAVLVAKTAEGLAAEGYVDVALILSFECTPNGFITASRGEMREFFNQKHEAMRLAKNLHRATGSTSEFYPGSAEAVEPLITNPRTASFLLLVLKETIEKTFDGEVREASKAAFYQIFETLVK